MSFPLPIAKWFTDSWAGRGSGSQRNVQPTVEWQVNGICNYDCMYCIQSRKNRVGVPSSDTIRAIIGGLGTLPDIWEVKMSGGEVFAFKGFIEQVVPELMNRTVHNVSVLTNFSAPINILKRFSEFTGPRLRITSASFHPDTANLDEFVAKAIEYRTFRQQNNPSSSFVVNVVMVPGKLKQHYKYRDAITEAGFRYFPQLMKIRGGVYPYDDSEISTITEITGGSHDPRKVNRAPSYQGLFCEAGKSYFIVDQTGEAYTCRTGKKYTTVGHQNNVDDDASEEFDASVDSGDRYVKTQSRLGSFVRGDFKLFQRGGLCPYPICPCTVPANRGIVHLPSGSDSSDIGEFDAREPDA